MPRLLQDIILVFVLVLVFIFHGAVNMFLTRVGLTKKKKKHSCNTIFILKLNRSLKSKNIIFMMSLEII